MLQASQGGNAPKARRQRGAAHFQAFRRCCTIHGGTIIPHFRREVDAFLEHSERLAPVVARGGVRLGAFGDALDAFEIVADDLAAPLDPGRLSVGDALQLHVPDEDAVEEGRDVGAQVLERHAVADDLVLHLLDGGSPRFTKTCLDSNLGLSLRQPEPLQD